MRLIAHNVVEGKKGCDDCKQKNPPISECQLPYGEPGKTGERRSQWIDLCVPCQERLTSDPLRYATIDTFFEKPTERPENAHRQRRQPRSPQPRRLPAH